MPLSMEVPKFMDGIRGSLDWVRSRAARQLRTRFIDAYVRDVFVDSIVVEDYESGEVYEFDWSIESDDLNLSNERKVELQYVALKRKKPELAFNEEVAIKSAQKPEEAADDLRQIEEALNVLPDTPDYGVARSLLLNRQAALKSARFDPQDRVEDLEGTVSGPVVTKNAAKKLVTTVNLVPGESDGEDPPIPADKVEEVAHEWMRDWQLVDYEHGMALGTDEEPAAIPVASWITESDEQQTAIDGTELSLPKGTWKMTCKVRDDLWPKVESGEIAGASIMGCSRKEAEEMMASTKSAEAFGVELRKNVKRVPLSKLGDWFCPVVSLLKQGQVPQAKIVAMKTKQQEEPQEKDEQKNNGTGWWRRLLGVPPQAATKSQNEEVNEEREDDEMPWSEEERKEFAKEVALATTEGMTAALKTAGVIEEKPVETEEDRRKRETQEAATEMLRTMGLLDEQGNPLVGPQAQKTETAPEGAASEESQQEDGQAEGAEDGAGEDEGDSGQPQSGMSDDERAELQRLRERDQSFRTLLADAGADLDEVALKALFPDLPDDDEDDAPAAQPRQSAAEQAVRQNGVSRSRDAAIIASGETGVATKGQKTRDGSGRRVNKPFAPVRQ